MKFANNCRLIKRDALLDDGWHPLDSVPAPDYVPPSRDGPHVGKRLVDGLRNVDADAEGARAAGLRQRLAGIRA